MFGSSLAVEWKHKKIEGTIKNIAFLTRGISVFYGEKQFQNEN